MNWLSGTSADDEIFNGYVMKLLQDKKHELQTALYDLQSELDKIDGLIDYVERAHVDSDQSARCEHQIDAKGYSARHDILTALASITELIRDIEGDLRN